MEGFITVLKLVAQTATVVVTIIKELISFIIEMANQVISFLNLFGAGISKIKSIQGTAFASAYGTQSFATGGAPSAMSGGGSFGLSSSSISGILGMSGGGGTAGGAGSGSGAGTGGGSRNANQRALAKLQADAEMLNSLVDQLTGANQYSSTLTQQQAIRRAEMATASPINITVNGAIDSESTARQIVQILNDSTARGTLGAGAFDR